MFAKVFSQILESSIADDYVVRHVFMDLLVMADRDGVVDMTQSAIARRTNIPLDIVERAIAVLSEPDRHSRSPEADGRRIILIDSHREWGWQIVNYQHYRDIRDDEARRTYFRDRKRTLRKGKTETAVADVVQQCPGHSETVLDSPGMSTKAEVEVDAEADVKPPISPTVDSAGITPGQIAMAVIQELQAGGTQALITLTRIARALLEKGEECDGIRDKLTARWRAYSDAIPQLKWSYGSVEKFFASGHWDKPDNWPWKEGHMFQPGYNPCYKPNSSETSVSHEDFPIPVSKDDFATDFWRKKRDRGERLPPIVLQALKDADEMERGTAI